MKKMRDKGRGAGIGGAGRQPGGGLGTFNEGLTLLSQKGGDC